MIPYIVAYIFYFTVLTLGVVLKRNFRIWILVASFPLIAMAILRGNVGVDTLMYEQSIDAIRSAGTYTHAFEPLFEYVVLILSYLFNSSLAILTILVAFSTILLYTGTFCLESRPYLLAAGIIPYYYLDMTMNGIRYGLAFSIVVFATKYLCSGKRITYFIFAVLAGMMQMSAGLLALLLIVLLELRWTTIAYGALAGGMALVTFHGYLETKLKAYEALSTNGQGSGLAPLLLSVLALCTFSLEGVVRRSAKMEIFILLFLAVISYIITRFSYAGVRFQSLTLFLIYLFFLCFVAFNKIKLKTLTIVILVVSGVLAAGFRLRNFYDNEANGDSPFAPYEFFWEQ